MVVPETKDGMVVTETKDGSPAKNIEANSAVAQDEKAEANKSKPHRHKAIARLRNFGRSMFAAIRPGLVAVVSLWEFKL
jgi:hypothetical protein